MVGVVKPGDPNEICDEAGVSGVEKKKLTVLQSPPQTPEQGEVAD